MILSFQSPKNALNEFSKFYLKNQTHNGSSSLPEAWESDSFLHKHFIPPTQIEAEPTLRREICINFCHSAVQTKKLW